AGGPARQRDKRQCDERPRFGVLHALINRVLLVRRLALDVALRREQLLPAVLDLEMNVRRATRIFHRLDRAKQVFAGSPGKETAKALEVWVALCLAVVVVVAAMPVNALRIGLP